MMSAQPVNTSNIFSVFTKFWFQHVVSLTLIHKTPQLPGILIVRTASKNLSDNFTSESVMTDSQPDN